jgi:hypothetical protein
MALKTRGKISFNNGPLSQPSPALPATLAGEPTALARGKRQRKTEIPASRQGLVPFGFFIPPEARRQIKGFAGLNGRTTQDIGQEMLDDWFVKHGMHRLAGSAEMSE